MSSLGFPFKVINKDLALSKDIKLDSIKSIVQTFKRERIRQPDYGNMQVIFRGVNALDVIEYVEALEKEIQLRTGDINISLESQLQADGLLAINVYFDERVYTFAGG